MFRRIAVILAVLSVVGCRSVMPPTELDLELGTRIDGAVGARVGEDAPGMAVMVIRDGVVVHTSGYGLADVESQRTITRTTPFRLASVTKQFTCMAILKLAEDGRLTLDDPALEHVPSLTRFGPGITIRHLMNHTSGLPEYYAELGRLKYEIPSADEDPLLTAADASKLFESWGEPRFAPGEDYLYSNPAYEQLGLIIEKVSGMSYGAYLKHAIFEPAGMTTAIARDRPEVVIPERAIGYVRTEAGEYRENDDHPGNWIVGAGGLYASLDDFYFWDRALAEDEIVSAATQEQSYVPAKLNDGKTRGYGLGWGLGIDSLGREYASHGGAWVGFRTHITRYREHGVTIVVLSNLANVNAGAIAQEVADLVFADEGPQLESD